MARATHPPLPQPIFHEPIFGEDGSLPDPNGFSTTHPSDGALYKEIGDLLKKDVVAVPPSRVGADQMFGLAEAYGKSRPAGHQQDQPRWQGHISRPRQLGRLQCRQVCQRVAGRRSGDAGQCFVVGSNRAAFLFHLGDVVYNFGEAQYYYDQFYEPFRNYPAPIFAIPGNHDSFVVPGTAAGHTPLDTFQRNFCSTQHVITPEAGSLHRTAMTQPGVYFTLDAPFVRIIGLFSNALEDPGVISNLDQEVA